MTSAQRESPAVGGVPHRRLRRRSLAIAGHRAHRSLLHAELGRAARRSPARASGSPSIIGRINIGQGAYALVGGYVSADPGHDLCGLSFWLSLPLAGLFCAAVERPDRPADPEAARRLFRHGDAGADRGGAAHRARAADHQRRQGHHRTSRCPARSASFGLTLVPGFRRFAERNARLLFSVGDDDGSVLRRPLPARSIRGSASCSRRSSRTRSWPPRWGSTCRRCACSPTRSRRFSAASAARSSSPSPSRSILRASPSTTASTSC